MGNFNSAQAGGWPKRKAIKTIVYPSCTHINRRKAVVTVKAPCRGHHNRRHVLVVRPTCRWPRAKKGKLIVRVVHKPGCSNRCKVILKPVKRGYCHKMVKYEVVHIRRDIARPYPCPDSWKRPCPRPCPPPCPRPYYDKRPEYSEWRPNIEDDRLSRPMGGNENPSAEEIITLPINRDPFSNQNREPDVQTNIDQTDINTLIPGEMIARPFYTR